MKIIEKAVPIQSKELRMGHKEQVVLELFLH
jgi:hypothetical protein